MKINKVIILNLAETPNELNFRSDLEQALKPQYELLYVDSDELLVDAQQGKVSFIVNNRELDLDNCFVFVRRLRKFSDLPALFCRLLLDRGVPFSDVENASHKVTTDKAYAIPALAHHNLPIPRTLITNINGLQNNIDHILSEISFPCVLKGEGSRGEWVFKVNDVSELKTLAEQINSKKESLLSIQELIPNKHDVRALFMGQEFIAAMKRTAQNGSFLNNVSQGGVAESETLTDEEVAMCAKARQVAGIDFAGVDFVRTDSGIKFLEVNKSPQLGGIRTVHKNLSVGQSFKAFIEGLNST